MESEIDIFSSFSAGDRFAVFDTCFPTIPETFRPSPHFRRDSLEQEWGQTSGAAHILLIGLA
jgi:hypothetical protein